ncbi:eIF2 kinase Gcn2p negative regulator [Puccinia graminis f. sp. tritici]|uniref:RWD domain-containing protein n=2 Tax=Puccinia graminis f. sp. tritici TaxID=56615 RepID=E3KPX7_PUCGT|nr:uncharacterized protein PGTG_12318 [Puccinia graminis f. sp. tritici CRL 75-36-700-3]EFP86362.1 hypothetical protein PGTG_12318 [Puccinia graminis f. sp. tritici CRL 75-36-700-3]KAA1075097.1 eIF2 kinase Gcn2p negative regulator [Puccinia graminis f. sp. tritici]
MPPPPRDSQEDPQGARIPVSFLVERLSENRAELTDELSALEAILGEESFSCQFLQDEHHRLHSISLLIQLDLDNHLDTTYEDEDAGEDDTSFELLLEIPDDYPSQNAAPRLTLLAKYLGPFSVTEALLESIRKAFEGKSADQAILYDGIENAREILSEFYRTGHQNRRVEETASEEEVVPGGQVLLAGPQPAEPDEKDRRSAVVEEASGDGKQEFAPVVHSSQPIVDRKSVFIGHAVALDNPKDVPRILQYLLKDKKIAKASHNMIAWRCLTNGSLHQDNDDDGESAAGSRMQHLLNILDVKNVFVCVSRWFGGVHLGSDRFKHINQATRDALLEGRFIPTSSSKSSSPSKASSIPGQHALSSGPKKKR